MIERLLANKQAALTQVQKVMALYESHRACYQSDEQQQNLLQSMLTTELRHAYPEKYLKILELLLKIVDLDNRFGSHPSSGMRLQIQAEQLLEAYDSQDSRELEILNRSIDLERELRVFASETTALEKLRTDIEQLTAEVANLR